MTDFGLLEILEDDLTPTMTVLDENASDFFDTIKINHGGDEIIEIVDQGISPGPTGESGVITVFFGTGSPPVQDKIPEGSIYNIIKNI